MTRKTSLTGVVTVLLVGAAAPVFAQAPAASNSQPAVTPSLDFSGTIFGNYQVRSDSAAKAANGGQSPNKFDLERVYLTFKMPVGDRMGIRATTDIFQNANGNFYNGWAVRLKYGYLEYKFANDIAGQSGLNALARIGILHTVVIDHEEGFWPRYLSQTGLEKFGFFSSADAGVAGLVSLPNKMGEIYTTVTNGPGYTAPETDRFKDFAARLTLTPLANQHNILKTFTISPWFYNGRTASKFATAATNPITSPLDRNRYGVLAGIKDPMVTAVVHYAHRSEGFESGANTAASPVVATDSAGSLLSAYAIVKPLQWAVGKNTNKLGAVLRWDSFKPRTGASGTERLIVAGLQWEPSSKTAFSLDYQALTPRDFIGKAPIVETKTWYLHWVANF